MDKLENLKIELSKTDKLKLEGWPELRHKFIVNSTNFFDNECELLLPLKKFIVDSDPFINRIEDTLVIDPNGGALDVSVIRFKNSSLKLVIKKNSIGGEILYQGVIDLALFFSAFIDFYNDVLDLFIPTNNQDREFLMNLKEKLKQLKRWLEDDFMKEITSFCIAPKHTEKVRMSAWDVVHYIIKVNAKKIELNSELFGPIQKFIGDVKFFLDNKTKYLVIDPSDGGIEISIHLVNQKLVELSIKENSTEGNIIFNGIMEKTIFLTELIEFYLRVLNLFIPNNKKEEQFILNLEKKLEEIKNEL